MTDNWRDRLSGWWPKAETPARPYTFTAELRSCHPSIAFDATFQLWWPGDDQAAFWAQRQKVTAWADHVAAQYSVTQAGNAENEINTRIPGTVVVLAVGPGARAAAEALLEIDRQTALERRNQQAELERIRYLRESVYSRPDVARSYWLHHHPDQLGAMLTIDFEGIAEKFGDVGESRSLTIARLIGDFLGGLDDSQRRYLLGQLGEVFSSYERPDLTDRLAEA